MCPAQVYEVGDETGDGLVELKLTPSNCVQCGAITARGRPVDASRGRLRSRVHADLEADALRVSLLPRLGHRDALGESRMAVEEPRAPMRAGSGLQATRR